MDLRRLEEVLDLALTEELPQETNLDEIILKELKNWEPEILDELQKSDLAEMLEPCAEANDYVIYDEALTIDVKGRPNIQEPLLSELNDKFGNDTVGQIIFDEIQTFIDYELPNDIVILGRSGGYWGYDNVTSAATITEHGYELMKNEVNELLHNNDLVFPERLIDAGDDRLELEGVVYDCIYSNVNSIAHVLLNNEDTVEIEPGMLEKMKELSDRIDEKEAEMNTEEFWSKYNED